jgi:hypothetical protein
MPDDTPTETRRVTVPPGDWTTVLDDSERDETIQVRHFNDRSIAFIVDPAELSVTFDTDSGDYPEDGWRVRAWPNEVPAEQHADTGVAVVAPVPDPESLLTEHPLVENQQTAKERTEAAIREAIAAGLLIELDQPSSTGARYDLTEAGRRHSEQQLGLPDGALG